MANLEQYLEPDSDNPLNDGFRFLVSILYALILNELLSGVLTNFTNVPSGVWPVVIVVLAEVLHYAIEDYLYTGSLKDPLTSENVHVNIVQYILHFLAIGCLYGAVVAITTGVNPERSVDIATVIGVTSIALAAQYFAFALWQGTAFLSEKASSHSIRRLISDLDVRRANEELAEAVTWSNRFTLYSLSFGLFGLGAWPGCSLISPTIGITCSFIAFLLGVIPLLTVRESPLKVVKSMPEILCDFWERLFDSTAPSQLSRIISSRQLGVWVPILMAFVWIVFVYLVLTIPAMPSSFDLGCWLLFLFLAVKADYLRKWSSFNKKLLGLTSRDRNR